MERQEIAARVRFEPGGGGLRRAVLNHDHAEAHLYLHGAHVTHFAVRGRAPILFLSSQSQFAPGRPIRGGVPICFPWFGPRNPDPVGDSPMHGFARILPWEVESTTADERGTTITLSLAADESTRRWWPHDFMARYRVTVGAEKLTLELAVTNGGQQALSFEEALHSYFAVADVREVSIDGLNGAEYLDKTDRFARKRQVGEVRITAETDRVYLATRSACTIRDPGHARRIIVAKENSDATVVWNPWVAKAKAMADFGDDEWPRMVCVETCNVGPNAVTLAPGATHRMSATIWAEGFE